MNADLLGTRAPADIDAVKSLRLARQHLAPGLALAQKIAGQGAVEWSAAGAEITFSDGRTGLDFGSYAVALIGHRHPQVVAAIRAQLDLMPTSTRTLCNPVTVQLAARLVTLLEPDRLARVWFGLNGSDVVEASLKLARVATGRPRVLAVRGGFHGKTLGALSATWGSRYRAGSEGVLGNVTHIDATDLDAVAREAAGGDVAALIIEPIQGEGGVRPLSSAVLRRWAADAHDAGGFVLADEIQTGLGRCGPFSMAVEAGLRPDAVLLGKALGGGVMPLSAMVCSAGLYAPIIADPFLHTSTFSGHPLSCAAALATLDVLASLQDRSAALSRDVESALRDLQDRHPRTVLNVRGQGLLWGIELAPAVAGRVFLEIGRRDLLFAPCLGEPQVLRLLPPMVTTTGQLEHAVEILHEALSAAAA